MGKGAVLHMLALGLGTRQSLLLFILTSVDLSNNLCLLQKEPALMRAENCTNLWVG